MASIADDGGIVDIGGSQLDLTFEGQLCKAFKHEADFPKEVAYTEGMDKWMDISDRSYQTSDEMVIIEATCKDIVAQLPSNAYIIDLGAANSEKYKPYVHEFLAQGKVCTYVALDICHSSLVEHIANAKAAFPTVKCIGLWGSFQDGDAFFYKFSSARLFLSLGSIFYNAPDEMVKERCQEFRRHLSSADRLVVGQDGPSNEQLEKSLQSYNTNEYDAFFTNYMNGIHQHAGISADANEAWAVESKMDKDMHYFEVTAKREMVCGPNCDFFHVKPYDTYKMFPSWKRGEAEIHKITTKEGLVIKTLGKAKNSGMRQYLLQAEAK